MGLVTSRWCRWGLWVPDELLTKVLRWQTVSERCLTLPKLSPCVCLCGRGGGVRTACTAASLHCQQVSRAAMPPRCQCFALITL